MLCSISGTQTRTEKHSSIPLSSPRSVGLVGESLSDSSWWQKYSADHMFGFLSPDSTRTPGTPGDMELFIYLSGSESLHLSQPCVGFRRAAPWVDGRARARRRTPVSPALPGAPPPVSPAPPPPPVSPAPPPRYRQRRPPVSPALPGAPTVFAI